MQALVVDGGKLHFTESYPLPEVKSGEALVKVLVAGICATDLEIVKGYGGFSGVLGHEFVGIVETATNQSCVGKRVVGAINIGCGQCTVCTQSGPEHCPQRRVLGIKNHDGAFAEYLVLPEGNLHAVPSGIADETAVFTEPLAAAVRVQEQLRDVKPASAAVVGPGRLGLLVGQVLASSGAPVIMLGRRAASLELARGLGLEAGLVEEAATDGFELVVEATGNENGLEEALRLVGPLGTVVMKSTFHGRSTVGLTKVVVGEITVVGSRCGPFEPALRLLNAGAVQVQPMISAEYPLAEGLAAFARAATPGTLKVLLRP